MDTRLDSQGIHAALCVYMCVSYTGVLALDWQLVDVAVAGVAVDGAADATLASILNGYGERDGHARNHPVHHRLAGLAFHIYGVKGRRSGVIHT